MRQLIGTLVVLVATVVYAVGTVALYGLLGGWGVGLSVFGIVGVIVSLLRRMDTHGEWR